VRGGVCSSLTIAPPPPPSHSSPLCSLSDDIKWISFHSGYDFGYLLKLLTDTPLPLEETAFFALMRTYFPVVYDVKQLMLISDDLKGGLQKLAEDLDIERVGPMHQAGSDSLLTAAAFFKLRSVFFGGRIDDAKYAGVLYGLGSGGVWTPNGGGGRDPPGTPAA
jgi:CCR4-NOT transcription complex subunit 7/8